MAKYRVIRPWFGVKMGQIVTLKEVHPALRANVTPVGESDPKESDAAAKTLDAAKAEAKAIVEAANVEAKTIVEAARKEAEGFIKGEVGETVPLVPATPDATADKAKATKTK